MEALAIAIRTYTVGNLNRHRADGFDLCDQTHCQVMRTRPTPATERAAQATAGKVLLSGASRRRFTTAPRAAGEPRSRRACGRARDDPAFLPSRRDDGCGGAPAWTPRAGARRSQAGACRRRLPRRPARMSGSRRETGRAASRSCGSTACRRRRFPDRICARRSGARSAGSTSGARPSSCGGPATRTTSRPRVRPRRRHVRDRIGATRRPGAEARPRSSHRYFPGPDDWHGGAAAHGRATRQGVRGRLPLCGRRRPRSLSEGDEGERRAITALRLVSATSWQRRWAFPAASRLVVRFTRRPPPSSGRRASRGSRRSPSPTAKRSCCRPPCSGDRGVLERTVRRALVHALADSTLGGHGQYGCVKARPSTSRIW